MKKEYYDQDYFAWQKAIGEMGGKTDLFKFQKHISPEDTVLDFGCGGGFLLKNLICRKKLAVEINDIARQNVSSFGIEVYKFAKEVPDNSCDIIISNHALEHAFNPYEEILSLYSKLKQDGKIIFVVPNEKCGKWKSDHIYKHLYTWTEMNLGNLFDAAGYDVLSVTDLKYRWPPFHMYLYKIFGENIFQLLCKINGFFRRKLSEIQIIAQKK